MLHLRRRQTCEREDPKPKQKYSPGRLPDHSHITWTAALTSTLRKRTASSHFRKVTHHDAVNSPLAVRGPFYFSIAFRGSVSPLAFGLSVFSGITVSTRRPVSPSTVGCGKVQQTRRSLSVCRSGPRPALLVAPGGASKWTTSENNNSISDKCNCLDSFVSPQSPLRVSGRRALKRSDDDDGVHIHRYVCILGKTSTRELFSIENFPLLVGSQSVHSLSGHSV